MYSIFTLIQSTLFDSYLISRLCVAHSQNFALLVKAVGLSTAEVRNQGYMYP